MNLRQRRRRRSWPHTRARIVAAFWSCVLMGCSISAAPPAPTEVPTRQWNAGEIVQALQQRDQQFHSLRALARLDYAGPEGKNGFQEAILIQRPDRLRLETLSFLGAIMIVTVDDQEILAYLPREDVFLRGQRSKENLRRLTKLPLPLGVEEVTALLLGLPPVNTAAKSQANGNSLSFPAADGDQDIVAFETNDPVPTRWERRTASGETEISVAFSDYAPTPAGLFPLRIAIESAIQKRRLEIRYQEPELNATLQADLFSQQRPPNVKELPIEALRE